MVKEKSSFIQLDFKLKWSTIINLKNINHNNLQVQEITKCWLQKEKLGAVQHCANRGRQRVMKALIQCRYPQQKFPALAEMTSESPPTNHTPSPLLAKIVYAREAVILNSFLTLLADMNAALTYTLFCTYAQLQLTDLKCFINLRV